MHLRLHLRPHLRLRMGRVRGAWAARVDAVGEVLYHAVRCHVDFDEGGELRRERRTVKLAAGDVQAHVAEVHEEKGVQPGQVLLGVVGCVRLLSLLLCSSSSSGTGSSSSAASSSSWSGGVRGVIRNNARERVRQQRQRLHVEIARFELEREGGHVAKDVPVRRCHAASVASARLQPVEVAGVPVDDIPDRLRIGGGGREARDVEGKLVHQRRRSRLVL